MDNIEEVLATIKETLVFLVEQEKIRGEEVNALNDKIEAVNSFMMDNIVNPSIAAYKEEQFDKFNEKYGERLGKYNDTLRTSMNDPEYDVTREAFNEMDALSDEEKKDIDEESYIAGVEQGLSEYVDNIKKSLGLPEDTAVEITADEDGQVEVKADENGDGEPETVVTEKTEIVEEKDVESETENKSDDESEEKEVEEETEEVDEVDPELKKELEEYANK